MATTYPNPEQVTEGQHDHEPLNALIGKNVLRTLGQPIDLHKVQVRQVWDRHYRINILVGLDASCARVAHSYFVVADGEGNIVESTPGLTKQY